MRRSVWARLFPVCSCVRALRIFSGAVALLTVIGISPGFSAEPESAKSPTLLEAPAKTDTLIKSRAFQERSSSAQATGLFEELPASRTGIAFQLQLPKTARHIQELIHLSVYGGICTGDYDDDGLSDFYVTTPIGGNRLFRNRGDFQFEDVTDKAGLHDPAFWGTGATFVDIDGDGDLDIYACGYRTPNRLFVNQGRDTEGHVRFSDEAKQFGLDFDGGSMIMAFADMDNDGDMDGYLATTAVPPPPGVSFRVTYEGNRPVIPKELQEYWAMLYLPGDRVSVVEAGQPDRFFRNEGGRFTDITKTAGIEGAYFTLASIWWDFDGEGGPDIYVANDYFGPDALYQNSGGGKFTDVIRQAVPHTPWSSMGTDIGDLNNDGRMDLMTTDMLGSTHFRRQIMMGDSAKSGWFLEFAEPRQYGRNAVFLGTGTSRMLEAAYLMGLAATDWTWGPRIEDYDNDGRVDVFIANGMTRDVQHADLAGYADGVLGGGSPKWAQFWIEQPMRKESNLAFRNLGDLRFERCEEAWGLGRVGVSFGAATADFDNDGDLDLVVNNADAPLSIYENHSATGHSIRVRLEGKASNRWGVGATIRMKAGGQEQIRYLTLARGWLSASEPIAHFGLGPVKQVDSLEIYWPSGRTQTLLGLSASRFYTISEPSEPLGAPPASNGGRASRYFSEHPTFESIQAHPADPYDDFARQPLLPKKLSERTFCMAWGDVDNDQDADLYLGGAYGREGRLFLQMGQEGFVHSQQPSWAPDSAAEDTAAIFFDADSDGDLDLYVVSGGVRAAKGDAIYRDRIYLNDGKGNFVRAQEGRLPDLAENGTCVAAADFDKDDDIDLFVGGGSVPGEYPLSMPSRLLVNKEGTFEAATIQGFEDTGLVTDAVWVDCDQDGWMDLLMTTEWGPVRLFRNHKGKLVEGTQAVKLQTRTGLWSAIAAGDIDNDRDVDFLVGNLGLNTEYRAQLAQPEMLFYGDLDNSESKHLLEAYFVGEFAFPHRGLDILSGAMPALKQKFPTQEAFARAPIERITSMDHLRRSVRREANTLESGLLINNGPNGFEFRALPRLAQIAPARDVAFLDADSDGSLDIVLAQNDLSFRRETGHMAGGLSLLLLGDGRGNFDPVWPDRSGIVVPDEARQVAVTDLNGDDQPDIVFGVSPGALKAFVAP